MTPLLQVTDLHTHYVSFGGERVIKAVDGVSFALEEGETLGLVGDDQFWAAGKRDSADDALPHAA
jgi:ABC-type oligopeptide transport system ATPase subunit